MSSAIASLTAAERVALDAIVEQARRELGGELVAVWLYGSRARGVPASDQSDIDVLVLTTDERAEHNFFPIDFASAAAQRAGLNPILVDVIVRTPSWLERRREIDSFFVRELDRDRIVVYP